MKTFTLATALTVLAAAVPANAANVWVVEFDNNGSERETQIRAELTDEQIVEIVAREACEKPFIRDLKAQVAYTACLEDARSQAREQLALAANAADASIDS